MTPADRRVAIVTGASGGIGRVLCRALVEDGFGLLATDRDEAALAGLARELAAGSAVRLLAADLADPDAAGQIVRAALDWRGRLDVLVNNAGLGPAAVRRDNVVNPVRFWELTDAQWLGFFDINTHAPFRLSRAAAVPMLARGSGRIITVTTSFGTMIRGGNAPYGPTKAASEALAAIMAADLEGTGVTVNIVVPGGMTNTPMVSGIGYDRAAMLQPEIMAPPVRWLVSDQAAAVTGRRFVAAGWTPEAPEGCGKPIAWPELGKPRHPPRIA